MFKRSLHISFLVILGIFGATSVALGFNSTSSSANIMLNNVTITPLNNNTSSLNSFKLIGLPTPTPTPVPSPSPTVYSTTINAGTSTMSTGNTFTIKPGSSISGQTITVMGPDGAEITSPTPLPTPSPTPIPSTPPTPSPIMTPPPFPLPTPSPEIKQELPLHSHTHNPQPADSAVEKKSIEVYEKELREQEVKLEKETNGTPQIQSFDSIEWDQNELEESQKGEKDELPRIQKNVLANKKSLPKNDEKLPISKLTTPKKEINQAISKPTPKKESVQKKVSPQPTKLKKSELKKESQKKQEKKKSKAKPVKKELKQKKK